MMTPQEAAGIARKIHSMVKIPQNQATAVKVVTEDQEERVMILSMVLALNRREEETSHS